MKIAAARHYAPRAMLAAIVAAIRSEERAALAALRARYPVKAGRISERRRRKPPLWRMGEPALRRAIAAAWRRGDRRALPPLIAALKKQQRNSARAAGGQTPPRPFPRCEKREHFRPCAG